MSFVQLAVSDARGEDAQRKERVVDCGYRVEDLARDRNRLGPSVPQQPPRFSNVTVTEAWHDFRFRAEDFPRLPRALRIPRRLVVLRNESTFHGKLRFSFSPVA